MPVCKFRHAKLESGIIDQNKYIGIEFQQVGFTDLKILKDRAQISRHFYKPHKSQIAVMFYNIGTFGLHQITAPCANIGFGIAFKNVFYQIASVQIARSFADNDVVFHLKKFEIYHKWNINKYRSENATCAVIPFFSQKNKKWNKINQQTERHNGGTESGRTEKNVIDKIGKRAKKFP